MAVNYTPEEERALAREVVLGKELQCPRCGSPVARRDVPPKPHVPYVRDRIWLVCGGCGRSAVLDRRRLPHRGRAEPQPDLE